MQWGSHFLGLFVLPKRDPEVGIRGPGSAASVSLGAAKDVFGVRTVCEGVTSRLWYEVNEKEMGGGDREESRSSEAADIACRAGSTARRPVAATTVPAPRAACQAVFLRFAPTQGLINGIDEATRIDGPRRPGLGSAAPSTHPVDLLNALSGKLTSLGHSG